MANNVDFTINQSIGNDDRFLVRVLLQNHHFKNACFQQASTYSCAIDSFLEICYRILVPYIYNIENRSAFFQLIINHLLSEEISLTNLRESVWTTVIRWCRSFAARDMNAEFSEIFSSAIFRNITDQEKQMFHTSFQLTGFCSNCPIITNVNESLPVITLSTLGIPDLIANPQDWPRYLSSSSPVILRCSNCASYIVNPELSNYHHPVIKFVEFTADLTDISCKFKSIIEVDGIRYILKAMARHFSSHFTCAVMEENKWIFLDDMRNSVSIYQNLENVYSAYPERWFFAVYIKEESMLENFYGISMNSNNLSSDSLKRKTENSWSSQKIVKKSRKDYNKKYYLRNKSEIKEKRQSSSDRVTINKSYYEKNKEVRKTDYYAKKKDTITNERKDGIKKEEIKKEEKEKIEIKDEGKKKGKEEFAILSRFHTTLKKTITKCVICFEAWPMSKSSPNFTCRRCKSDKKVPKKFSLENNMIPSAVPACLSGLTQVEEMLISRALPIMQVYTKPRGGQLSYKGHVITLPNNIKEIVNVLPHSPKDIPILIFQFSSKDSSSREFKVRREVILNALLWLTGEDSKGNPNNPLYYDVSINHEIIQNLPIDGIPEFKTVNFDSDSDSEVEVDEETVLNEVPPDLGHNDIYDEKVVDENTVLSSFLPTKCKSKKEKDVLEEEILQEKHKIGLGDEPFNEFKTQYLASMAFPTLFPDAKGDPTNNAILTAIGTSESESFAEKVKHLIKFAENINSQWFFRFAAHPRFPFWAYNMLYRRRLLNQGNFYLKQNPGDAFLTLEKLQEMASQSSYKNLMYKLSRYVKNISGTNSYWYDQREKLKATILQIGTPTIFWTLSCAEFHWPEFHSMFLRQEDLNNSAMLRKNIIQNPHLIDWFFTVRTENFIKYWLYEIMGASWHWYRFEYAVMRGSIHCHGLAKLKGDPGLVELGQRALTGFLLEKKVQSGEVTKSPDNESKILDGKRAEKAICLYVDSLVCAENPIDQNDWAKPKSHPCKKTFTEVRKNLDSDYANLVNSVQRHTQCNSSYCLRYNAAKKESYCRFNFPMELKNETKIEYEQVCNSKSSEVNYRPIVVLKRNDSRLNRHNRVQLQGWRANVDVQAIIDHYACLEYITKYASKSERTSKVINEAFSKVLTNTKESDSGANIIRRLMIKSVGERDYSIQEVMHHLLSLKLYSATYSVISASLEGSRKILLKQNAIESEPSHLDNYAQRANFTSTQEILNLNFISFVSNYYVSKGQLKKRDKEVIVQTFPKYCSNPESQNYSLYCKFQLIKYKPWFDNPTILWNGIETSEMYCQKWLEFLSSDSAKNLVPDWRRLIIHAETFLSNYMLDSDESQVNTEELNRESWMEIAALEFQIDNEENSFLDIDTCDTWESTVEYTVEQLLSMSSWLDERKKEDHSEVVRESVDPDKLNKEQRRAYNIVTEHFNNGVMDPLFLIIAGAAGCGKSYVLNCLRQALGKNCIVASFFGIAAFSIGGQTLHSLLQLPIRGKNRNKLKGLQLAKLQERLQNVKYIIIDEFSVIGQKMLCWIDSRCRQGKALEHLPFGGISVILVGDVAQLPPVLDKPLYHRKPGNEMDVAGLSVYYLFTDIVILKVNQRCNSDDQEKFRNLLLNVRNGVCTVDDWKLLMTRSSSLLTNELTPSHVRLSFSNDSVQKENLELMRSLQQPIVLINARHSKPGASKLSPEEFGGLEAKLKICLGARVMLTRNLWTEKGLCNGSMGYVVDIVYRENEGPPGLPICVIIQFDKYTGPSFLDKPKCVPIIPVTAVAELQYSGIERQQLPLKLSWAITIHKAQGLTLDKVYLDIGLKEYFDGLTYVALSRVKELENMILRPFSFERLQSICKIKSFKFRKLEEERLQTLALNMQ